MNAAQAKQQVVEELVSNPPNDGPWTTGNQINDKHGWAYYNVRDALGDSFATLFFYAPKNSRSNARLMAAAPQMLSALREANRMIGEIMAGRVPDFTGEATRAEWSKAAQEAMAAIGNATGPR
jgi:hypothetical protein